MATTYKEIWANLSKVDVSEHIQKKGQLSYLSWAWAWGTLMEHYPNAKYIDSEKFFPDGSCQVRIDMDIDGCDRHMWLAVMDFNGKAVLNPPSTAISNGKMRCLVKVLAMFGLGHFIYAGEDLPPSNGEEETFDLEKREFRPVVIPVTTKDGIKSPKAPVEVKAPVDANLFSFTAPDDLIVSDASAKQMGYLRSLLVKAGQESSPAFDLVVEGQWPTKDSVSEEINALLNGSKAAPAEKKKPTTTIPIPPSNPDDPYDGDDDGDLPF